MGSALPLLNAPHTWQLQISHRADRPLCALKLSLGVWGQSLWWPLTGFFYFPLPFILHCNLNPFLHQWKTEMKTMNGERNECSQKKALGQRYSIFLENETLCGGFLNSGKDSLSEILTLAEKPTNPQPPPPSAPLRHSHSYVRKQKRLPSDCFRRSLMPTALQVLNKHSWIEDGKCTHPEETARVLASCTLLHFSLETLVPIGHHFVSAYIKKKKKKKIGFLLWKENKMPPEMWSLKVRLRRLLSQNSLWEVLLALKNGLNQAKQSRQQNLTGPNRTAAATEPRDFCCHFEQSKFSYKLSLRREMPRNKAVKNTTKFPRFFRITAPRRAPKSLTSRQLSKC